MHPNPTPPPTPAGYGLAITLKNALKVASAAEAEAGRAGLEVIIAVVDAGGHLVCLHRMDNAQFGSIQVAQAKAESAVAFRRPTKIFEDSLAQTPRILALSAAMPVDGGLPLLSDGKIIGGIGVAGATPEQDGTIAKIGAEALS